MCFYNDSYDWYAELNIRRESKTGPAERCSECGDDIEPTAWRRTLFQQESEEYCKDCDTPVDDDECECDDGPNMGETYRCVTCRPCAAMLAAIKRQERDEGCPADAQQPDPGELAEVFCEHHGAAEYARRIQTLFPSLSNHKFVVRALTQTQKEFVL